MARSKKAFKPQRETLIHIALDTFIQNGYEQTTMTQLRTAFNLSVGGMYHYFSSKEEVLDAIIQYGFSNVFHDRREKLLLIPLEQRLCNFITDSTVDEFAMKLFNYSAGNRSSLVAYKLREHNVVMFIPLVTEIFQQSISAGLYMTDFSEELAEFSMLLAKAIFETNFLPKGDLAKRKRRVDALLHMFRTMLQASETHIDDLRTAFYSALDAQERDNSIKEGVQNNEKPE